MTQTILAAPVTRIQPAAVVGQELWDSDRVQPAERPQALTEVPQVVAMPIAPQLPFEFDVVATVHPIAGRGARRASDRAIKKEPPPPPRELSLPLGLVAEFHRAFNLPVTNRPTASLPRDLAKLRVDLLVEEVKEFADATDRKDLVAIADALADIAYVTYGAAVTYGIDLDAVLIEVHRSNMSKLGHDGRPVLRDDGKVLKPRTYRPPNILAVLQDQLPLPF